LVRKIRRAQSGPAVDAHRFGYTLTVRIGDWDVRPLGGAVGCLLMIVVSLLLSIALTVLVNLLL